MKLLQQTKTCAQNKHLYEEMYTFTKLHKRYKTSATFYNTFQKALHSYTNIYKKIHDSTHSFDKTLHNFYKS